MENALGRFMSVNLERYGQDMKCNSQDMTRIEELPLD